MVPAASRSKTTAAAASQVEGNGLRGMRERVEMLGGTLHRDSQSGTRLTITLPLKEVTPKARGLQQLNPTSKDGRKTIRVVLAEDQGMVLGALAALLEIEGDISVVAQARDGKQALEAVLTHKPDVLITDIEMPLMTGLDAAAELKRRRTGTRVIILTTFARAGYLRRAMEAGALGYLLKDMRAEELADAVRRVQQGLRVIHPDLATEAWGEMDPLTDRERQVLRLAGEGMQSADIATELGLSEGTVRNYLSEAISKMGASNRVEASRMARTKGWL